MKRSFDFVVSLLLLIVLAPVILALAMGVAIGIGSPVFFRQQRPGLGARPFELIKFRTMSDARDEHGNLLPDGERLSAFGRLLRASSLDELPELLNVLRGEMSLVGPRPLLMQYVPLYSDFHSRRHEVRPGVTGWAQVNGRNTLNWDLKLDLDVWYVDNQNFWLDLRILALTAIKVARREGISAAGEATMLPFQGSHRSD